MVFNIFIMLSLSQFMGAKIRKMLQYANFSPIFLSFRMK